MKNIDEKEKEILEAYIKDFIDKSKDEELKEYIVDNSIPVVWFGDIDKYMASDTKVITIALNPSVKEFNVKKSSKKKPCKERFDEIDFSKNSMNENIANLRRTLNEYFHAEKNPYMRWFRRGENALNAFDASYFDQCISCKSNTAIHIDIYTAIATDPTWGKLKKDTKDKLQNTKLFKMLFDYLDPNIVLVSMNKTVFNKAFAKDYTMVEEKFQNKNDTSRFYIRKYKKDDKHLLFWIFNNRGTAFGLEHEFMKKTIQEMLEHE